MKTIRSYRRSEGFTLIEMSVVLVIIGLITGGILLGKDLIQSSKLSAQITQINKYNSAVGAFNTKYGALPGDIGTTKASQYGFATRAGSFGRGNEDGILQAPCISCGNGSFYGWNMSGETALFWEDLTAAKFIDGSFTTAVDGTDVVASISTIDSYLPAAKMGQGNFVYVFTNGGFASGYTDTGDGLNYFGFSQVTGIASAVYSKPGISVAQAYNIDKKMDDGLPTSGWVKAVYNNVGIQSAPNAASSSISTCYDTTTNQYSTTQNNGIYVNCALSFQFQ